MARYSHGFADVKARVLPENQKKKQFEISNIVGTYNIHTLLAQLEDKTILILDILSLFVSLF